MKYLNQPFVKYLILLFLVDYAIFSFLNWNFNPGFWTWYSRIIAIILFLNAADNYRKQLKK